MSRRPIVRAKDRQRKRLLERSDGVIDRTEVRVQEMTAALNAARAQLTDLRLREAMARRRAEALQAEVERLDALLKVGLLRRFWGAWRRASVGAAG